MFVLQCDVMIYPADCLLYTFLMLVALPGTSLRTANSGGLLVLALGLITTR